MFALLDMLDNSSYAIINILNFYSRGSMYRCVIMCMLAVCNLSHAAVTITIKNTTNYDIKAIATGTTGSPSYTKVYRDTTGSVTLAGVSCCKYIELQFYKTPKRLHENARPVSWSNSYRVKPKNGRVNGKELKGVSIDAGKIYYNLGATWGAFYCYDFTIQLKEEKGEIKLVD